MNPSNIITSVNTNSAFLFLEDTAPKVRCPDGSYIVLPNVPWSRWYLRTHFKTLQATKEALKWYKDCDPLALPKLCGLNTQLREYQKLALARMILSNCALWLDMGLGKTLICLAHSVYRFIYFNETTSLIICPPTIFVTWKDEITKHLSIPNEIIIAHSTDKLKNLSKIRAEKPKTLSFILTSYESLNSVREILETLLIHNIYLDESSKIKNMAAKRTQSIHAIARFFSKSKKFCLSGTPSTKDPLGLYSQYEILGKNFSGSQSYLAFEKKYAVSKLFMTIRLPHGKVTSIDVDLPDNKENWLRTHCPPGQNNSYYNLGYCFGAPTMPGQTSIAVLNHHKRNIKFKNLEELHKITQTHAYTLEKLKVLDELPEKIYEKLVIELSPEQKKAYKELVDSSRTTINSIPFSFTRSSPFVKLHQIANGYILDLEKKPVFFSEQPKLKELENLLEQIGDKKLVIWSPFIAQINQVTDFLQAHEIKTSKLTGSVSVIERENIIHEFQNETGTQILVANPAVGGFGLNLTCASYEIFMTNWFSPDVRKQAEDRLHRLGQKNSVTVIDLVSSGTLEVSLLRNTFNKIDMENKIISMSVIMGEESSTTPH